MKKLLSIGFLVVLAGCIFQKPVNPDPNHTHADFAVWIGGIEVNYSSESFMSGSSTDAEHTDALHPHLHLHDGIGHVIHRHKPGLTFGDFLESLDVHADDICPSGPRWECIGKDGRMRLFVNGIEEPAGASYVFEDTDQLLLTDAEDGPELETQLKKLTKDACLYSQTCPWKGKPPVENCIADPEVPCVAPLD